jgi:hypothetical protein
MHEHYALLIPLLGTTSGGLVAEPRVRLHQAFVQTEETELPPEICARRFDDPGTGSFPIHEPEVEIVTAAVRYVQAIAALPVSEEDDRIVEDLMRRRLGPRPSEAL